MTGIVVRVGFIARTVLRNLPNDIFGVIASREGAFGEGPVVFGLAQVGAWRRLAFGAAVIVVA